MLFFTFSVHFLKFYIFKINFLIEKYKIEGFYIFDC